MRPAYRSPLGQKFRQSPSWRRIDPRHTNDRFRIYGRFRIFNRFRICDRFRIHDTYRICCSCSPCGGCTIHRHRNGDTHAPDNIGARDSISVPRHNICERCNLGRRNSRRHSKGCMHMSGDDSAAAIGAAIIGADVGGALIIRRVVENAAENADDKARNAAEHRAGKVEKAIAFVIAFAVPVSVSVGARIIVIHLDEPGVVPLQGMTDGNRLRVNPRQGYEIRSRRSPPLIKVSCNACLIPHRRRAGEPEPCREDDSICP